MLKISVIVPLTDTAEYLDKALDSLIHQTSEDFEVIIVDAASTDGSRDIAQKYCDEYVGFYLLEIDSADRHAAFNRGIAASEGEYLFFYDPAGYCTDETVEELIKSIGDDKVDMLIMREWLYGDHRYSEYEMSSDVLAILPSIDKGEKTILNCPDISNKVFRRAIIESHNIRFDDNPFSDLKFIMEVVMASKLIRGCPLAVYERRTFTYAEGFTGLNAHTRENLEKRLAAWDDVLAIGEEYIRRQSGHIDGDESYLVEICFRTVMDMIRYFYRYFWDLDDDFLKFFVEKYNIYANRLSKEKLEFIRKNYKYLYLPFVFDSHEIAAAKPMYSFLLDLGKPEETKDVVESLYVQTMPFFELFVKESVYNSEYFPAHLKNAKNLRVLPDEEFYAQARRKAGSKICINIRDGDYMDENVVRETFLAAVPGRLKPLVFSQKRKNLSVKKKLKEKGLNI